MSKFHILALACSGILTLSACGTIAPQAERPSAPGQPAVAAPSLGFFSRIRVPDDREAVLRLQGRGVQIFRCEKRDSKGVWMFRQPEAELVDESGRTVGRHGANFTFEHVDGSRLIGTIAAHDEAPKPDDLRWLLITTRSFGKGAFESVTHVQRVNTEGGMPPASCDLAHAGRVLRIDFTSDFVFYRPRATSAQ